MNNKIKVLYHKDCLDGFSSAWVAWTIFGNSADYIPAVHSIEPPEIEDSDVYFLDFIYPKEITDEFVKNNKKVIAIDHHQSEKETVKSLEDSLYGENNSAAVLTWKYFYSNKKVPKFLKYIEDVDLWNFNMENTREVIAFLTLKEKEFDTWTELVEDFEDNEKIKKILKKGEIILKHKQFLINRVASKASEIKFEGHKILSVNSPILISDVGAKLYEKKPPFAVIWYKGNGKLKVSMRSNGKFDVSKIAKKYRGGGHPASASFKLNINEDLPWTYINKNEQQ